jgi:hypothetical protein
VLHGVVRIGRDYGISFPIKICRGHYYTTTTNVLLQRQRILPWQRPLTTTLRISRFGMTIVVIINGMIGPFHYFHNDIHFHSTLTHGHHYDSIHHYHCYDTFLLRAVLPVVRVVKVRTEIGIGIGIRKNVMHWPRQTRHHQP